MQTNTSQQDNIKPTLEPTLAYLLEIGNKIGYQIFSQIEDVLKEIGMVDLRNREREEKGKEESFQFGISLVGSLRQVRLDLIINFPKSQSTQPRKSDRVSDARVGGMEEDDAKKKSDKGDKSSKGNCYGIRYALSELDLIECGKDANMLKFQSDRLAEYFREQVVTVVQKEYCQSKTC